jgi:hypothetical protein
MRKGTITLLEALKRRRLVGMADTAKLKGDMFLSGRNLKLFQRDDRSNLESHLWLSIHDQNVLVYGLYGGGSLNAIEVGAECLVGW